MRSRLPEAAVVAALLYAGWFHGRVEVLPYDDAFITYRYVENALAGHGLVYNPGERVLGCTTPAFLLWLLAWKSFFAGVPLPELAVRTSFLSFAASVAGMFACATTFTGSRAWGAAAAVALALNRDQLGISSGGMEPFLFLALALFALWALAGDRPLLFGALTGLALLTRPEGVVLPVLGAAALVRTPVRLARSAAVAALPVGAWALFALAFYGSVVPQSVRAKAAPVYPLPPGHALERLATWLGEWAAGTAGSPTILRASLGMGLLLALSAAALTPAGRERRAWIPAGFLWLQVALYGAGNPLLFGWYWPPVAAAAILVAAVGAASAVEALREPGPLAARWTGLAAGAWLGLTVALPYALSGRGLDAPLCDVADSPARLRVVAYRQAAEAMAREGPPGGTVAAPEVGALGYYYPGPLRDACGLVSPEAMPFLPAPPQERPVPDCAPITLGFVEATRPDWVAALPTLMGTSLQSEAFRRSYAEAARVPLPRPVWGSREVVVFRRVAP